MDIISPFFNFVFLLGIPWITTSLIDAQIEAEKEKLIDAKIELAMLKDKAKDIMTKFTDDITNLQ